MATARSSGYHAAECRRRRWCWPCACCARAGRRAGRQRGVSGGACSCHRWPPRTLLRWTPAWLTHFSGSQGAPSVSGAGTPRRGSTPLAPLPLLCTATRLRLACATRSAAASRRWLKIPRAGCTCGWIRALLLRCGGAASARHPFGTSWLPAPSARARRTSPRRACCASCAWRGWCASSPRPARARRPDNEDNEERCPPAASAAHAARAAACADHSRCMLDDSCHSELSAPGPPSSRVASWRFVSDDWCAGPLAFARLLRHACHAWCVSAARLRACVRQRTDMPAHVPPSPDAALRSLRASASLLSASASRVEGALLAGNGRNAAVLLPACPPACVRSGLPRSTTHCARLCSALAPACQRCAPGARDGERRPERDGREGRGVSRG